MSAGTEIASGVGSCGNRTTDNVKTAQFNPYRGSVSVIGSPPGQAVGVQWVQNRRSLEPPHFEADGRDPIGLTPKAMPKITVSHLNIASCSPCSHLLSWEL